MLTQSSIRLWLICVVLAFFHTPAWCQSRHIDVKAVDEHERPLVDATVMITIPPEPPEFLGDGEHLDEGTALKRVFAQTNASGAAKVDVSTLDVVAPDQPLRVMVSKKGYGLQTVTAQKQARIRCLPVLKRRFQILDAEGRPMAGLKVQHQLGERVAAVDEAKLAWWTDEDARTKEFGVVTLDGHANGSVWFEMITADGVRHQVGRRYGFSNKITSDLRDLVVVRLSRYGKIAGQLSAEFTQDYAARLIPKPNFLWGASENTTGFDTRVELQPDGKFSVDAAAEGTYWLVVSPKPTSDRAQLMKAGKAPQTLQEIQVVAGQTISVSVDTVSLAKVSGRLVSTTSGTDFSSAQVRVLQELPREPPYPAQLPPFGRVPCLADGTFECWLPPGRYELGCVSNSLWSANKPLSLDVGAGAATITAGQLLVSPTKPAKVAWQSGHRMPTYLQNHVDHRLFFSFKDMPYIHCNLTHDGYGQIFAPVGVEPPGIHQNISNSINPRPNPDSALVDIDPTENYQLELITKGQGVGSNISLRGRVVDTLGNGISNVPVNLALDYKIGSGSGMGTLDSVKTEADGSFQIPPRQFLGHLKRSSAEEAIQGTFTFSAFILANPEPVEVQKIISLKSQAWELNEIEFPDIVVEPPLVNKRLNVQLHNASAQPAAGEFIQVADQRRLIGAMADANGRVEIENMTGPTWILRSSDWSIHAIDNYDQPLTLAFEAHAAERSSVSASGRLAKEQRQALARQILQTVPVIATPALPIAEPFQPLSDEAYLSPDKSFQHVLLLAGPEGDTQRLQFASFWNRLGDDRLQQLVAAMGTDMAKMELLRIVADRQPSAEAYARVMDAIPLTNHLTRSFVLSRDPVFEQVAEVGLKLHHLGKLDLHRDKIRQFVEYREAVRARTQVVGRSKPFISQQERNHDLMCRALVDPEQFAREALQLLSMEQAELSREDRDNQSLYARLFVQLYPKDHHKLPMKHLRLARGEEMMNSFGEQAPLSALEVYKQGQITAGQLRQVAEASLLSHHPDADSMVRQANILLVRSETPRERILDAHNEIGVYQAARRISPALGRQQAWLMARDYLSGRYEVNTMNIMPAQNQLANRALAIAYCLKDEHPQLAQQISRLSVPRVLNNLERKFEQRNWDAMDMTMVAWFEPQATCDLLIKLSKRYADELQQQNAQPLGQPGADASRLQYMANDIAALRHACLRGLLLDEL